MNTPNKLTVLRIILVPFMVAALLCSCISHRYLIAGLIFIIASITDMLDGKIARKQGLITDFGKFADPLADKILVISAICCFTELKIVSSVVPILILFREFAVTSVRLVAVENGKVIAANMWGKAKTVSQMIAIIFVFFSQYFLELIDMGYLNLNYDFIPFTVYLVNNILLWISVVLTVISGIVYIIKHSSIFSSILYLFS